MLMRTKKDVVVVWRSQHFPGGSHGDITVPKGTLVSPIKNAPTECFVDQFGFLPQDLRRAAFRYGIRVPAADCERFISLARGVDLKIRNYAGNSWGRDGSNDDGKLEQRCAGRVGAARIEPFAMDEEQTQGQGR